MTRPALAAALALAAAAAPARAQDGDAPEDRETDVSGAAPRVTTRADVRLRIDSGPGVDTERLQDWSEAVGARAGAIRDCYARRVAEAPTVEGRLRLAVALRPRHRRPTIERRVDALEDRAVERCVLRALSHLRLTGLRHPETVFVDLTFRHSHAAASRAARSRAAAARESFEAGLAVRARADGRTVAVGSSGNGLVGYETTADTPADARRLATLVHRRLPGLFDCRRRAGRWRSPAGELVVRIAVDARGRIRARLRRSTVADGRAGGCATEAFRSRPVLDAAAEGEGPVEGEARLFFFEDADVSDDAAASASPAPPPPPRAAPGDGP